MRDLLANLQTKIDQIEHDQRKLIFWYDNQPEGRDLLDIESSLAEQNIYLWRLTPTNFLRTKVELEMIHADRSFLIYAPFSKPPKEENVLWDMLSYGAEFKADDVAMIIERYQVEDSIIRPIVEQNMSFFKDRRRTAKLEKILPRNADAKEFQLGIIAVLVGSSTIEVMEIVRQLLVKGLNHTTNEAYQRLSKFFQVEEFWNLVLPTFGIYDPVDGKEPLKTFFYQLLFQNFSLETSLSLEDLAKEYRSQLPNTCHLFIDDWLRGTPEQVESLEAYILDVESAWSIDTYLEENAYAKYDNCDTFRKIDVHLIAKATEELLLESADIHQWQERITVRKMGHWGKKEPYQSYYHVLEEAFELARLKEMFSRWKKPKSGIEWFAAYTDKQNQLYRIDQVYRRMWASYEQLEKKDGLQELIDRYTNWYENVYLHELGMVTDELLKGDYRQRFSNLYVKQQRQFYTEQIQPILDKESTRVFVIISDALRYEAGAELADRLNKRVNAEVNLTPMQASLPSFTQLGMASLLPHQKLTLEDGQVFIDGHPTRGLINRQKILQRKEPQSIALVLDTFVQMTRSEGEALLKGKRVVYLYHNRIDALGDNQKSEQYTYSAVGDTLDELERAISRLVGSYAAKQIFITSDHGFLFQLRKVEEDAKSMTVEGEIFDKNRRFVIGKGLSIPDGSMKLSLDYLDTDLEAVVAKGLNRFKGGGGLRFIHGGAMPQESIIPLIDYHENFGKGRKKEERVEVRIAMREKVITNYRMKVIFFQEQKIEGQFVPRYIRAAFYKNEQRISNEVLLMFDHKGEAMHRHQEVYFSLLEQAYRMGETCELRMEDVSGKTAETYRVDEFSIRIFEALF
jgi:uncharacterized protein (TIGR02687 family)